ncbi:LUD domain-containing protein [Corynebacterium sp.]|uniref:LutC/YkgG family protein n=1 Tax=Corynebacterium sp. TaxID=1720 RepID=UPI0026DD5961|nr:LUD domain-containing protein [Corynebacterium sp.]MDO4610148.1 LUD domain-containing protein [Corynebacterium sp.]
MSGDAKAEILARIRAAHAAGAPGADGWTREVLAGEALVPGREYPVPRDYVSGRATPPEELVDLLVDRLEDYGAAVARCGGSDEEIAAAVAAAVGAALVATESPSPAAGCRPRIGVPPGLPAAWTAELEAALGAEIVVDDAATDPRELDARDAVVTSSAVTAAETGTIMLDGTGACGRRALTLVPDVHVCIVPLPTLVHGVPEAVATLAEHPERPATWISGPSATSDIELNRVEGVHGPRTLSVIIAG